MYSKHVPSRLGRPKEDKGCPSLRLHLRCKVPCFIGIEHSDVLSKHMDSDLVIYRTTLVRTLQVALSVISRGSWDDVARRFTMIQWCKSAKELRFWSWIVLGVDPAIQSLKCQFPRGIDRSQEPRHHQGIIDSAFKNPSIMVSVQYGPSISNIPTKSTIIGP
ncbi:hypothetical protein F511_35670 [Dorcoceras hygrometricum]|uniref:Uncharacterized protein n=1 Tax=Dorcoceras hygrometricum TaxID=472368 RepID=A0A2Z7D2Z1_9LAMI|nr:hypothetical protein F511_35670 [Dorcoceras hygrometricum]